MSVIVKGSMLNLQKTYFKTLFVSTICGSLFFLKPKPNIVQNIIKYKYIPSR